MGSTSLEELYLGDNSLHGTIPALVQGSPLTAFLAPDQEVRALHLRCKRTQEGQVAEPAW